MKKCMMQAVARSAVWTLTLSFGLILQSAVAQDTAKLPYMDPSLPAEQRAVDLVHRMTLAEKATQMYNNSDAIPRLNIPAYQWWSEALHGVIDQGVTEYPEPIGLAATFDAPGIHRMATQIGIEGRIKHVQDLRAGHTGIFGGLDFWSPNLNIFRDPRWGRGQETYGEDPFLTGRMGVAYVTGMQGDDPKYYRAIATPKHYAWLPRRRRGRQGRFSHVRLQRHQWRACLRQPVPAAGPIARQVGLQGLCGIRLRSGS
jgi:beta-glucosidase